tara:strand:+ start:451 stop:660 length:210 start_codon:yes stop_codon:yes gene_type:complete
MKNNDYYVYVPKHPDYLSRMKIMHGAKRIIIEDVATTKIGKVFAVISTIKRLILNNINLNNKGGDDNAK